MPEPARPSPREDSELAAVIRQHQAATWRYLRCLGAEPDLADDLTQETFLAVLRVRGWRERQLYLRPYLRTVALRVFLKARRKRPRRAELDLADAAFERMCPGDDDGTEYVAALRECVRRLGAKSRAALDLRYRDGLSRRELARRLELSEDGVKSLLARAKSRLRRCVEGRLGRDS